MRPWPAARIRRAFAVEVRAQRAERLVEKLPINSFRIGYIRHLFPDARFIHLIRHGADVARSIADRARHGVWFGQSDYKWRLLARDAQAQGAGALLDLCTDDLGRGLLEWRLSVQAAREALAALPAAHHLEVRYEALLADPVEVCAALEAFIGIPPDAGLRGFALAEVGRGPASRGPRPLPPVAECIAGPLLAELGYQSARWATAHA